MKSRCMRFDNETFSVDKHKFFDFMAGGSEHKKLLGTSYRQCTDVFSILNHRPPWLPAHSYRHSNAASNRVGDFFEYHHFKVRMLQSQRFSHCRPGARPCLD